MNRVVVVATVGAALATLPVWLTSSLAVLISDEVPITDGELGLIVASYFAASALVAVPAGELAERVGPRWAVGAALAMTLAILVGIPTLGSSPLTLALLLACAGMGSATMQPAANLSLVRGVPQVQHGAAFGLKAASVPLSTFAAGLAVPMLGLRLGWRSAFLVAAGLCVLLLLFVGSLPERSPRCSGGRNSRWGTIRFSLVALSVGAGFSVAAATGASAFIVPTLVSRGIDAGIAGVVLAAGSVGSGFARIMEGRIADRRQGRHLPRVAALMAIGAGGAATLAVAGGSVLVSVGGVVLLFGAGWGWNGLLHLSIVRQYPTMPAFATGVTQPAIRIGGVLGPILFGTLSEQLSRLAAWVFVGALMGLGSLAVVLARIRLRYEREAS